MSVIKIDRHNRSAADHVSGRAPSGVMAIPESQSPPLIAIGFSGVSVVKSIGRISSLPVLPTT